MKKNFLNILPRVLKILRGEIPQWKQPIVGTFAQGDNAPFKVLISTVLSLRTKDLVTEQASHRLFALSRDVARNVSTPEAMLKLSIAQIEKAIYPVGFYHTKAKNIHSICQM